MNIPDEAVEAAAKVTYEARPMGREMDGTQISWDGLSDFSAGRNFKENALATARAALEAAAPHLAAATLRDAADALADAASWSTSKPGPEQIQRWLKSRAAAIERPTP